MEAKKVNFKTTANEFSLVGLGVSVMGTLLNRGPNGSITLREILEGDTDNPKFCAELSSELTQLEAKLAQAVMGVLEGTPHQDLLAPGFQRMIDKGARNVN